MGACWDKLAEEAREYGDLSKGDDRGTPFFDTSTSFLINSTFFHMHPFSYRTPSPLETFLRSAIALSRLSISYCKPEAPEVSHHAIW